MEIACETESNPMKAITCHRLVRCPFHSPRDDWSRGLKFSDLDQTDAKVRIDTAAHCERVPDEETVDSDNHRPSV